MAALTGRHWAADPYVADTRWREPGEPILTTPRGVPCNPPETFLPLPAKKVSLRGRRSSAARRGPRGRHHWQAGRRADVDQYTAFAGRPPRRAHAATMKDQPQREVTTLRGRHHVVQRHLDLDGVVVVGEPEAVGEA